MSHRPAPLAAGLAAARLALTADADAQLRAGRVPSRGDARTAARFRRTTRVMDSSVSARRTALLAADGAVEVSGVTRARDEQAAAAGAAAVVP